MSATAGAVVAPLQEGGGSIRGVIYDRDFEVPLADATVTVVETGQKASSGAQGNYVLTDMAAGSYTLIYAKPGFVRQVRTEVIVSEGRLTDLDIWLSGEFTEMEEFVVQDILQIGAGTETALLALRFESPALMDSIGSDLISRAGASDAAGALRLISGASLQDGKTAVVRGLPDRYVSSQLNGMRLPTANEDKRAVELDQFPSSVIESLQVTKTFTPDQQGDASGGAVDVRLRGVPEESFVDFKAQLGANSQVYDAGDGFLTYDGGGVNTWGQDDSRVIQTENIGDNWTGAVGTHPSDAPPQHKLNLSLGVREEVGDGWVVGGFASLFYERDASFFDDGQDNQYWVDTPGEGLTPRYTQGAPPQGNFLTSLFDVTQASESVQWGGLGVFGVENEYNKLALTYLYSHTAEDTATLAIDQRGKEFYFPDYDVSDPTHPGNDPDTGILAAPWLRFETLDYVERTRGSLMLEGKHTLPFEGPFGFRNPQIEWTFADSFADQVQPDKRLFGAAWLPFTGIGELWIPVKPAENFNLGNLQRIFKSIEEESTSIKTDLKLPFEQWSGDEGYLKFGVFADSLDRSFNQDTFSNSGDNSNYAGGWDDPWSAVFPDQDHPVHESPFDIDYEGRIDISAWYSMIDLPLGGRVNLIGGARFETTEIGVVNFPDEFAFWFPPGAVAPVSLTPGSGDADVDFQQDDVLPSIGLNFEASDTVTLRASYSQTIARQTFKELTPILQQEYLGGPVFIGNPSLEMSSVDNFDVRADWRPYEGALLSVSGFHKEVEDPIEYVQKLAAFTFTTAENFPEGTLSGVELEARQDIGRLFEPLGRLGTWNLGANATLIESNVQLPEDLIAQFASPAIQAPTTERDMTNAPEYLFNIYLTYDLENTGTRIALFYTVQGDTLVEGAGISTNRFVPDVYQTTYDTLNLTLTQQLGRYFRLEMQAKNLTNAPIETVYRSEYTGPDEVKTRYTAGIDFAIAIGARFSI
ncbi:MAG TPA: TonB-dependent receptor [Planctomycetota bacterium]|nr:TonB-dependent receptor [Planctomycetota bacterium]